ncbi:hypothetical protein HY605_02430, partial [Candidatus Peregrinibacteria bacterium]|nr:hypothetical protein [Candidatus Peregrinibacteria bacterium]
MTLTRTFDTIKWLELSEQSEMVNAALDEPYPDIQRYAVATLFDDKLKPLSRVLFNYFPRLTDEVKRFLVSRRWNLITLARNVLKEADDNSRMATLDVLSSIGGPDICGALVSVIGDSSQRIMVRAIDILEEIFVRFFSHYSAVKTNHASRVFVEENKGIVIETMKVLLDNYETHKRQIFAKALVELGTQVYP